MRKLFSLFAALTLSVGLWAETVSYLYPEYIDGDVTKGIDMWQTSSKEATPISSSSSTWGAVGVETWLVVSENVTISQRVTCKGDVRLILADGAKLTAQQGITVSGESNSLTIYAQSTGTQMGKLIANATSVYGAAGIGGTVDQPGNNITINGGIVEATGAQNAAGIGGGCSGPGNNITINGGKVTANGGDSGAAGIGSGYAVDKPTTNIIINGGEVTANGSTTVSSAGIGCTGLYSSEAYGLFVSGIYINGGKVTAIGSFGSSAIGGKITGYGGYGSNIFVATNLIVKAGTSADPTNEIAATRTATTDITDDLKDYSYVTIELAPFTLPDKTAGQYATICLPRPMIGVTNGTLYKISYGNIYEVHFVEETNFTADPAGTPYLVQAEADGDIVFTMADAEPVTAPVGVETANGFVASLQEGLQDMPEGYNYLLVSGGVLHSAGPGCQLSKNHAYIDINYVPAEAPAPQCAPRRVTLYNVDAKSPTALGQMNINELKAKKVIDNGQFVIIRDNMKYNAQGQIIK